MQQSLVALIVAWCCGYAVWALLPLAARRAAARRLLPVGWPAPIHRRLQRAAAQPTGCACDGCDRGAPGKKAPQAARPAEQPIRIHRSLKR